MFLASKFGICEVRIVTTEVEEVLKNNYSELIYSNASGVQDVAFRQRTGRSTKTGVNPTTVLLSYLCCHVCSVRLCEVF